MIFAVKKFDEDLKTEAQLYHAYSMIKKRPDSSPHEMINFLTKDEISAEFKEWGLSELYFYHRRENNVDSVNHYLNILVNGNYNNHLGHVRNYAEFLYKQNINISRADSLTKEYTEYGDNFADHWTPYLKAHSLARQGDLESGIILFNSWMDEYSKPENFMNDFWHYHFYIEFVSHNNLPSDRAIKYAEMIENYKSNAQNKRRLAKIYSINGMEDEAIKKLKEAKDLYENPKQKSEIDKIITEYTSN